MADYENRLAAQEEYRKKDKKSKSKWDQILRKKSLSERNRRNAEDFRSKRNRLEKIANYQNWKTEYKG